jgi:hypothetical protein
MYLGSFCLVQLFSNLMVTVFHVNVCPASPQVGKALLFFYIVSFFGLAIASSSLLGHRYMLEKARVMTITIMEEENSGLFSCRTLETWLKWEARILLLVPVGALAYSMSPAIGYAIAGPAAIFFMITDTGFSISASAMFLKPILDVIHEGEEAQSKAAGMRGLQTTKWMTLVGTSMIVLSSSLLCECETRNSVVSSLPSLLSIFYILLFFMFLFLLPNCPPPFLPPPLPPSVPHFQDVNPFPAEHNCLPAPAAFC